MLLISSLDQLQDLSPKYNVRLTVLARELKISESWIVNVLRSEGFDIHKLPSTILNEEHIFVLSLKYVDAIKRLYNQSLKNYYSFSSEEIEEYKTFFSYFGNDVFTPPSFGFFKTKLKSSRISEFFFEIVSNILLQEAYGPSLTFENSIYNIQLINKIIHKVRLKIKRKFNFIFTQIYSILISCHYYIFSDEEDSSSEVSQKIRFSRKIEFKREALFINNLKFLIPCKNLNYS